MAGLYVASNTTALGARYRLQNSMNGYTDTLTRLSTGLKINSAKDDPAGLIASELLKSDIIATNTAISNTQRANSVLAVADSALGQISSLLNDVRGLVVESANTGAMSDAQIEANQLQIDASLDAIDRIAQTTNFQGKKLLDGSQAFQTQGTNSSQISNLVINSANFGTADAVDINVVVDEAAKKGTLMYYGGSIGNETTTIDVTGSLGSKSLTFGPNASVQTVADAINASKDSTGVQARVEGALQRGSAVLHSVGANNDIVVTAADKGQNAGDWTFEIVSGGAAMVSADSGSRVVTITAAATTTAADVIGMLNKIDKNNLGAAVSGGTASISEANQLFKATNMLGDNGSGLVMAMNAAGVWGDVANDNAIQFIGTATGGTSGGFAGTAANAGSGGTVVRLIADRANQSLHHEVRMVTSDDAADIASGLSSGDYVLEVYLATDGAGNSNTTAKDLAAYFDREDVKAQGTNGISAEVYYPDGVDPAWRTWNEDECGNVTEAIVCGGSYGNGFVQATQTKEACGYSQEDIYLLQANQKVTDSLATLDIGASGGNMTFISSTSGANAGMKIEMVYTPAFNGPPEVDSSGNTTKDAVYVRVTDNSDGTQTMTIHVMAKGINPESGGSVSGATMTAGTLQNLLNHSTEFKKYFIASGGTGTVNLGTNFATVQNLGLMGTTSGARTIDTQTVSPMSGGIAMHGQSDSNERLILEATEYGSNNFVQVTVGQGRFDTYCPQGIAMNRLEGTDMVATINGYKARGNGTNISVNTGDLSMSMDMIGNKVGSSTFSVTGGGSVFQIGPEVKSSQQVRIGLQDMSSTALGGASGFLSQLRSGGNADMFSDTVLADRIVNEAISQVASFRGRIGAIQKATFDPNIAALQDNVVALSEAQALIEDADFAEESSNLTRYQILVQAGANVLAQSNQIPQYAAMLVG